MWNGNVYVACVLLHKFFYIFGTEDFKVNQVSKGVGGWYSKPVPQELVQPHTLDHQLCYDKQYRMAWKKTPFEETPFTTPTTAKTI